MTRLIWDRIGDKQYEAGIDSGVLYLEDGSGIAWNGLVSIEEESEEETTPIYFDGVKQNDLQSPGDFTAVLTAFTYPNEFLEFESISDLGNGLFVDDQTFKCFGLSYKTYTGNALGEAKAYFKIHLLYNLIAIPNSISYETISAQAAPIAFSWKLLGYPQDATNYRPTAHIILDSKTLPDDILAAIEDILYGEVAGNNARLPTINELIVLLSMWDPKLVVPQTVTGLATLSSGSGDLTQTKVLGVLTPLPTTRLVPSSPTGFYELIP